MWHGSVHPDLLPKEYQVFGLAGFVIRACVRFMIPHLHTRLSELLSWGDSKCRIGLERSKRGMAMLVFIANYERVKHSAAWVTLAHG